MDLSNGTTLEEGKVAGGSMIYSSFLDAKSSFLAWALVATITGLPVISL